MVAEVGVGEEIEGVEYQHCCCHGKEHEAGFDEADVDSVPNEGHEAGKWDSDSPKFVFGSDGEDAGFFGQQGHEPVATEEVE